MSVAGNRVAWGSGSRLMVEWPSVSGSEALEAPVMESLRRQEWTWRLMSAVSGL
jgi:hypothetical protein